MVVVEGAPTQATTKPTSLRRRGQQSSGTTPDDVFRSFHRARVRAALRVRVPLAILASLVLVAGVWGVAVASPKGPSPAASAAHLEGTAAVSAPTDGVLAGGEGSASVVSAGVAAPAESSGAAAQAASPPPAGEPAGQPIASTPVVPGSAAAPVAPAPLYSIMVTARGHQAELDSCQWVRMDVSAIAPIVGAHNFCHGDIVLAMAVGEIVTVTGTDLDGDYQITGSRDAHAGDNAAQATAGLTGDIIFQTCYWDSTKGLRLVTAVKVDLSLPPIVVG